MKTDLLTDGTGPRLSRGPDRLTHGAGTIKEDRGNMNKVITSEKAPQAIGPYSHAVLAGNTLYSSGQCGFVPETGEFAGTDIVSQTEQLMKNLGAVLSAAGMDYTDAVKTTCFLADMKYFAQFNEIYSKYFTGKPARSCIAVRELPKGALAEVELIAVKAM